jgi:hypothetical protein
MVLIGSDARRVLVGEQEAYSEPTCPIPECSRGEVETSESFEARSAQLLCPTQ